MCMQTMCIHRGLSGYAQAVSGSAGEGQDGTGLQTELGLGEQAASSSLSGLRVEEQADVGMQHPRQPGSNQLQCPWAARSLFLQACKQAGGVEVGHADGLCGGCVAADTQATPASGTDTVDD